MSSFWKFSTKICWSAGALYKSAWMFIEIYCTKLRSINQDSSWFINHITLPLGLTALCMCFIYAFLFFNCSSFIILFIFIYVFMYFSQAHRRTYFILLIQ